MHTSQVASRRLRVMVADSSPITSQLIGEAIAKDARLDVVGFSSEPTEIVSHFSARAPDVLLISARMHEEAFGGLRLLRQLRAEYKGFRAVVLIDSRRADIIVGAFRAGASGVFSKSAPLALLSKCVFAVHDGQIWANSEELSFVLASLSEPVRMQVEENERLRLLSKREREVVQCLAEGLTNRQIAEILKISPHTVKNYIFSIFEKLGVANRVELALYVLGRPVDKNHGAPSSSLATQKKPPFATARTLQERVDEKHESCAL